MYKFPNLIFKGFIIGLAKIIPGVSGSLFALYLGLYERGIDAISNFFKRPKSNLIFLGNVGIGIMLSIIVGTKIISYTIVNYYLPTMLLFIGLMSGSIPKIFKKVNMKSKKEYLFFILTFIFMLVLFLYKNNGNYIYNNSILDCFYVILIGFIDAATMIIPGISGTAIFMLMGCYNFFLSIFSNLTSIQDIIENFKLILLFLLGLFSGILIMTKLINYLLTKKPKIIYPIILGFSISSILVLLFEVLSIKINIGELFIGIILLFIGYRLSKIMSFE